MLAKPVVDRLERNLEGKMRVLRLGAWSKVGREFSSRYSVRALPTFFLFDGSGNVILVQIGRLDAAEIRAQVDILRR